MKTLFISALLIAGVLLAEESAKPEKAQPAQEPAAAHVSDRQMDAAIARFTNLTEAERLHIKGCDSCKATYTIYDLLWRVGGSSPDIQEGPCSIGGTPTEFLRVLANKKLSGKELARLSDHIKRCRKCLEDFRLVVAEEQQKKEKVPPHTTIKKEK